MFSNVSVNLNTPNQVSWPIYQENEQTVFNFDTSGFNLTSVNSKMVDMCMKDVIFRKDDF